MTRRNGKKAAGEKVEKQRIATTNCRSKQARLTTATVEDIQKAGTVTGKPEKFLKHQEKKINHEAKREFWELVNGTIRFGIVRYQ